MTEKLTFPKCTQIPMQSKNNSHVHLLKAWDFSLKQVPIKVRQQVENTGDVCSIQNICS